MDAAAEFALDLAMKIREIKIIGTVYHASEDYAIRDKVITEYK